MVWDSATRAASGYIKSTMSAISRPGSACIPATSVPCSPLQRCLAPGKAAKATSLQMAVPSPSDNLGNKEGGREIERKRRKEADSLGTHYNCPIYQLQGHLGARVAASEMHPVFLGTMCSMDVTSEGDQSYQTRP